MLEFNDIKGIVNEIIKYSNEYLCYYDNTKLLSVISYIIYLSESESNFIPFTNIERKSNYHIKFVAGNNDFDIDINNEYYSNNQIQNLVTLMNNSLIYLNCVKNSDNDYSSKHIYYLINKGYTFIKTKFNNFRDSLYYFKTTNRTINDLKVLHNSLVEIINLKESHELLKIFDFLCSRLNIYDFNKKKFLEKTLLYSFDVPILCYDSVIIEYTDTSFTNKNLIFTQEYIDFFQSDNTVNNYTINTNNFNEEIIVKDCYDLFSNEKNHFHDKTNFMIKIGEYYTRFSEFDISSNLFNIKLNDIIQELDKFYNNDFEHIEIYDIDVEILLEEKMEEFNTLRKIFLRQLEQMHLLRIDAEMLFALTKNNINGVFDSANNTKISMMIDKHWKSLNDMHKDLMKNSSILGDIIYLYYKDSMNISRYFASLRVMTTENEGNQKLTINISSYVLILEIVNEIETLEDIINKETLFFEMIDNIIGIMQTNMKNIDDVIIKQQSFNTE